jgi:DNA-binding transcriptional LysR family regulator
MHEIEWSNVDLNLLVVLDALLTERSVTRAARRLGKTPSATSHALSRCRSWVGDPLLVRSGRGLVPTPRAQALGPRVSSLLAQLGRALTAETVFDPARTTRRVSLVCPDLLAAFLPELLDRLQSEAPGLDLDVVSPGAQGTAATVLDGSYDLGLGGPPPAEAGLRTRRLGSVRFALVVRQGHALAHGPLDVAAWLSWPHVVVKTGTTGAGWVAEALAARGLARRIGLTVPSFLLAPHAVARTDLVLAAPRSLVAPLAGPLGLVLRELPLPMPPVPVSLSWPEHQHDDPGHRWIRSKVAEIARGALDT